MAHEDLSESFKSSTETLSNQVRYVNYSLIAVVWLLGGNAVSGLMTNGNGLILLFILLSLFLDLCQYIWTSVAIWHHNRRHNLPVGIAAKIAVPKHDYIAIVTWTFYVAKVIACLTACVMLASQLIDWWVEG
jgi:hypothetical protein